MDFWKVVSLLLISFGAGYGLATFVYHNNKEKMDNIVNSVNEIKDNLKKKA